MVVVLGGGCGDRRGGAAYAIPGERITVTVEVLNGTSRPGLARLGTRQLRRAGIDVVYFGNASPRPDDLDSTLIVVRRGAREAVEPVRRTLGVGTVVVDLDSARLLDASVLLGRDFRPRLEFHP